MDTALREVIEKLLSLKGECTFKLINDLEAKQLTMNQLNYLSIVERLKATTISELSETLNVSKPTVTESIKKLERSGYITKHKCAADARIYYIELTERGSKLANLEQLSVIKLVDLISEKLTREEVEHLVHALSGIS